jgi:hypothetical protein
VRRDRGVRILVEEDAHQPDECVVHVGLLLERDARRLLVRPLDEADANPQPAQAPRIVRASSQVRLQDGADLVVASVCST